MGSLIKVEEFECFRAVKEVPPSLINDQILSVVRNLDEKEELEPFIRSIIYDYNETPHGPAEIADIFTHRVTVNREQGMAAFILKGKSFKTVRPTHVAHQIYRLEKISGLKFAIFAATGIILDAVKEHFCTTAERQNCKYAIFDVTDLGRLFIAYGFLCPRDARRIIAGRCKCGYSPQNRILNVFQNEALKTLEEAHAIGQSAGLIILPPSSGKTRIAAEDSKKAKSKKVLYVAHTHEILDVAMSEFEAVYGKKNVRLHETETSLSELTTINIATIQLLQRHINRISSEQFDYLIIDEFHHAAANTYRKLIEKVEHSFLLGLTATPYRGDRQDILELCNNNIIVNYEMRTGIDIGILSPYHYFGCFDNVDYSKIKMKGNNYDIRDLEKALIIPERDEAIILKWKEKANEKPTIAFCCSRRHAERMAESFIKHGINAEVYLSDTVKEKRAALISDLQQGELKIICTVDVLNEGADFPFVECLLFLRPTESQRVFYQQLGRGLRKYVGKSHCIVIDFIGNFKNAYKLVEYQGLQPFKEESSNSFTWSKNPKDILNLPLGCTVNFDDKVLDIFAQQTLDPRTATRHNIGRILIYQYQKLCRRLRRIATKADVDRNLILNSDFYKQVFGSWKKFEEIIDGYEF